MKRTSVCSRRAVLHAVGAGVIGAAAAPQLRVAADEPAKIKGNIKQSVCRWCYGKIPLQKLAAEAKKMGYKSIELLDPHEYTVIKTSGLTCAMLKGTGPIPNCLNRKENH